MITGYHRPETLTETLTLLQNPEFKPLGGGTQLNQRSEENFEVVDLQGLSLNKIHKTGDKLEIGATVTLQALLECSHIDEMLRNTIRHETPINLRNMGTIAGTLVAGDGRSPFSSVMLALDASLTLSHFSTQGPNNQVASEVIRLGEFLPQRDEILHGKLITKVEISVTPKTSYEYIARTPGDKPIVAVATSVWKSGRTRVVLGGWGRMPTLAMDGNSSDGAEIASRNAAHEAVDEWASAEYRREMAAVLTKRCLGK